MSATLGFLLFLAGVAVGVGGPSLVVAVIQRLDPERFAEAQRIAAREMLEELKRDAR